MLNHVEWFIIRIVGVVSQIWGLRLRAPEKPTNIEKVTVTDTSSTNENTVPDETHCIIRSMLINNVTIGLLKVNKL
jgi:hypothetical protein